MGIYLNPGSDMFQQSLNSMIFVDKSDIIAELNKIINTNEKYICISRPRRFGKSMTMNMVSAYYDRTVESSLFSETKISKTDNYTKHRGAYDVLFINMQNFLSKTKTMEDLLRLLESRVGRELVYAYPDIDFFDKNSLAYLLEDIYSVTKRRFVILIDEWDCIFREEKNHLQEQKMYLDFLRDWLKDNPCIALTYMTGILPIKKYGTHSALNMFREISMMNPVEYAGFTGFTECEVKELCQKYQMDFEETKKWYDGYTFPMCRSIYNPRSIVSAMQSRFFDSYWNQTETFDALRIYIDMNFDGLRDAVITLMAGNRLHIDVRSFTNDMVTFNTYEDIFSLLVHLGYLAYDVEKQEVFIPNKEVMQEFVTATSVSRWHEIVNSVKKSRQLLQATFDRDEEAVASGVEAAHFETSHLQYNDENALSYVVSLAYYAAREYYTMVREMPTGKGFADMVFLPRKKYADRPAMIVELKWDKGANTAIKQIKAKQYVEALQDYHGQILLVGISYDKKSRKHECRIEKID